MKRHLACAEQQHSPSSILRLPRKIALQKKFAENIEPTFTVRGRFDLTLVRASEHELTRPFAKVTLRASETHFVLKIITVTFCQISPNAAPETKSVTPTSPNVAPATKSSAATSPNAAPATKSDAPTLPNIAPAPKNIRKMTCMIDPATTSEMWAMCDGRYEWCDCCLSCYLTETELLLNCYFTELLLYWTVTWLSCCLTGLLLYWTVTNCFFNELLLDWAVTWLNCCFIELLLDWAVTLLTFLRLLTLRNSEVSHLNFLWSA